MNASSPSSLSPSPFFYAVHAHPPCRTPAFFFRRMPTYRYTLAALAPRVYVTIRCDGLLPSRLTPRAVLLACVFRIYMCSPASLKLFSFVFFASLLHDHPVILLLLFQSLLSHALVCVPTVPALLLVSMHPLVLLGVLVLPRPSHHSASTAAIRIRSFLVSSFGLEFPRSSSVFLQRTGWCHRRGSFTDARFECCSFLSWLFFNPPPSVFLWRGVGSSLSCFSSINCASSHLCCVSFCVRSEFNTSHLSLPCVVKTLVSGTQFPTRPIYC